VTVGAAAQPTRMQDDAVHQGNGDAERQGRHPLRRTCCRPGEAPSRKAARADVLPGSEGTVL
jgi:hypothetical protein